MKLNKSVAILHSRCIAKLDQFFHVTQEAGFLVIYYFLFWLDSDKANKAPFNDIEF